MKKWLHVLLISFILSGCSLFATDTDDETTNGSNSTTFEHVEHSSQSEEETTESKASTSSKESEEEPDAFTLEDYTTFNENEMRYYEGEANEFSSFTVYPQYIEDGITQVSQNNGGTISVMVYEWIEEYFVMSFREGEIYHRNPYFEYIDDTIERENNVILLKEPFEVGSSWTHPNGTVGEIISIDETLNTSAGSYEDIIVVELADPNYAGEYNRYFFAPNHGMIRIENYSEDEVINTATLARVEETEETYSFEIFKPDDQLLNFEIVSAEFSLGTNESVREAMKELLVEHELLTEETTINTLYKNPDGAAYIDLSQEYIDTMNAGSSGEWWLIQSLVNTIGTYYQTTNVYLTIDGKPLKTGHILMEEGEAFQVNLEGV